MSLRLGLDVDGVLANFRTAFEHTARKVLGVASASADTDPLSHPELDRVWKQIARAPNWWTSLTPYEPGAIAHLYAMARAGRWEVCFLTKRPASGGDAVQFQTQWWLEQHGFYLPSVITVPGSRGELANALRLDLVVDDQFVNCAEIIGASPTKAVLMLRETDDDLRKHAIDRGIGVVSSLAELIPVLERVHDLLRGRRPRMLRLAEWFRPSVETLPHAPAAPRPRPALVPEPLSD